MITLDEMDIKVQERRSGAKLDYYRKALMSDGLDLDTVNLFIDYHKANPQIWHYFKHFAFQAIDKGKKVGAKGIFERLRWQVEIESNAEWKVNNNYAAYYARIFAIRFPAHKDFFEKRNVTGIRSAA